MTHTASQEFCLGEGSGIKIKNGHTDNCHHLSNLAEINRLQYSNAANHWQQGCQLTRSPVPRHANGNVVVGEGGSGNAGRMADLNTTCNRHVILMVNNTSQWLKWSCGLARPLVRLRISSAKPKLSTTGRTAVTLNIDEPSRNSSLMTRPLRRPMTAYILPSNNTQQLQTARQSTAHNIVEPITNCALRKPISTCLL